MKNFIIALLLLATFSGTITGCVQNSGLPAKEAMRSGFSIPPDSVQTSVYWYWISDNISKEGVVKDLHAMKEAGINRAFIGNIGQENVPYGKVKMFSDEWWDILHIALKTATDLGIDIGIFNSPGWSQSGGPWIEADESMRYLASSELHIKGPQHFRGKLEVPARDFQDVRLIAFPAPEGYNRVLNDRNSVVTSVPSVAGIRKLTDGDLATGITFPAVGPFTVDFSADEPFVARSLTVYPTEHPVNAQVRLMAQEGDRKYRTVAEFGVNRSNPALHVGFIPYAPVTITFPEITASAFRLVVEGAGSPAGLAEVKLSAAPGVERYAEKTLAKMHQTPLPYWHDYLWREQPEIESRSLAVDANSVIDISEHLSTVGVLNWEVPDGEWIILRTGMTPTGVTNSPASPEATGLEVDKMSRKHVEKHFDGFMGKILRRIPEEDRKSFKVVVQDSYETGGQNFTDSFLQEFKERYNYTPLPFLPVYKGVVVNSREESDRFLWDMRRLVADKVAYDYVGGLRAVSHKYGLRTWLENYGHWGFPGEFMMYGGQSDEIGGEFWSEGELGNIENRAATSSAHIYGKRKVSAESNTSAGSPFSRYPALLKQRGDRFFAEGINNTLLHVYITQPYEDKNPGVNAWFGTEFNRKNTWFSQIDEYINYLKRVNFMLQQGNNVADVAYFIGEDAPKMTGVTNPALPVGYQFDYMNAEVILNSMSVENGLLTLPHGIQYRILVLPELSTMRPQVLAKIKQLVYDGAVVLGPAPTKSPSLENYPQCDLEVQQLAVELWGNVDGAGVKSRGYGKGIILDGVTLEEAFDEIGCLPDCNLPHSNTIHYGHRTLPDGEIYFVSNQTNQEQVINPEFRVTGKQPELWNPVSGEIRRLPAYTMTERTTTVPLKFAPYQSYFVVFLEDGAPASSSNINANFPDPEILDDLSENWTVTFDPAQRGPQEPVTFDTLHDWSESLDERIKYYSGQAVYKRSFIVDSIPENQSVVLNLGNLTAMAKVYINGSYAGGVWTPPYQAHITPFLKPGENVVEVHVVNTWVNRLIGDQNLPEDERQTWCSINPYTAAGPLQPSGLFGPVTLAGISYDPD